MATARENLQTRYDAIAAELAAGQTPDGQSFRQPTVNADGQSMDTVTYVKSLYDEMAAIEIQLASPASAGGQPFFIQSKGI